MTKYINILNNIKSTFTVISYGLHIMVCNHSSITVNAHWQTDIGVNV